MPRYAYVVVVEASSRAEADTVMCERINYDDDYGFTYAVDFFRPCDIGASPNPALIEALDMGARVERRWGE